MAGDVRQQRSKKLKLAVRICLAKLAEILRLVVVMVVQDSENGHEVRIHKYLQNVF